MDHLENLYELKVKELVSINKEDSLKPAEEEHREKIKIYKEETGYNKLLKQEKILKYILN